MEIQEIYCEHCHLATPTFRNNCIHCGLPLPSGSGARASGESSKSRHGAGSYRNSSSMGRPGDGAKIPK